MTGVVLALAALTCGDGGPGAGPAREPLRASFAGRWAGRIEEHPSLAPIPVDWDNDRGVFTQSGAVVIERAHFSPVGDRQVILTCQGRSQRLPCVWRAGQVSIYLKQGGVMTLRPAAPRKP